MPNQQACSNLLHCHQRPHIKNSYRGSAPLAHWNLMIALMMQWHKCKTALEVSSTSLMELFDHYTHKCKTALEVSSASLMELFDHYTHKCKTALEVSSTCNIHPTPPNIFSNQS